MRAQPTWSSSTRARSSTRRDARSIDTILALDGQRRDGARLVVTGCMAERYGDELAEALPEVDQVAGFGSSGHVRRASRAANNMSVDRRPGAVARSAQPAPAAGRPRRGPTSRSPRGATARAGSARSRASAGRSAAATWRRSSPRSTSSTRARSCSSPRTSRRTARTAPTSSAPVRSSRWSEAVAERVDRVRLLYLYPSDLSDALIDAILRLAACRTSTCRCSTSASRCCAGCGAGATATGSCAASPTSATASRTPRSGATSSSGTRVRPRPTTTNCSSSSRPRSSTGAGSSRTAPRTARTRSTSTAWSMPELMNDRLAELRELQDDDHGRQARRR